jgi:hypothetical protein
VCRGAHAMHELLTRREASELSGLSVEFLRRLYAANQGPPVVKLGNRMTRAGRVRYPRASLIEWCRDPAACTTPARPVGLPRFTAPRRRAAAS